MRLPAPHAPGDAARDGVDALVAPLSAESMEAAGHFLALGRLDRSVGLAGRLVRTGYRATRRAGPSG
ncbi:hypothetical protein SLI_8066 [Streptomyces lividans 1326]|uniref:Uncharacterized protein n=1 Tax=Streptomyces lividans 1326 TaxID=1200984 RepID=A0A7U9HFV1_STRLI|nr:hypothetical protein SLI_8066 [Streptomyces lividans 1326]